MANILIINFQPFFMRLQQAFPVQILALILACQKLDSLSFGIMMGLWLWWSTTNLRQKTQQKQMAILSETLLLHESTNPLHHSIVPMRPHLVFVNLVLHSYKIQIRKKNLREWLQYHIANSGQWVASGKGVRLVGRYREFLKKSYLWMFLARI